MDVTRSPRTTVGALLLAAATLVSWWAWLGWDTRRTLDPVTGAETGPYEVWQVAGCVLTLALLAFGAAAVLSPWLVAPVMTVAFTAAWAWRAATTDDSGLWVVGTVLVLVGMAVGTILLSLAGRRWLPHLG